MKSLLFAAAMALPVAAAATVAMEPQQATPSSQDAASVGQAGGSAHRQLFIVKYVLRRPLADKVPQVVMDAKPQIVPPSAGGYPSATLGALPRDPNTIICYGWGCESGPH